VIEEVRSKGGGHLQHLNTVWDEEILGSTSIYSTIRGRSIVLVTAEARLVDAAVRAGAADRVVDLDAYEKLLGLDPWPPQDNAEAGRSAQRWSSAAAEGGPLQRRVGRLNGGRPNGMGLW